jgi:hypothetical protein
MSRMAICAVVSAFVLASPLPAQDSKPAPAPTPPAVKKDDTFAVFKFLLPQPTGYTVEIVDVCKASELESKQKELDKITSSAPTTTSGRSATRWRRRRSSATRRRSRRRSR